VVPAMYLLSEKAKIKMGRKPKTMQPSAPVLNPTYEEQLA